MAASAHTRPSKFKASKDSDKPSTSLNKRQRTKGGCLTCRVRGKKCDEGRVDGSCEACRRLRIECLGYASNRPPWLKKDAVGEFRRTIKEFLMENAHRSQRHSPAQPLSSSASDSPPFLTFDRFRDGPLPSRKVTPISSHDLPESEEPNSPPASGEASIAAEPRSDDLPAPFRLGNDNWNLDYESDGDSEPDKFKLVPLPPHRDTEPSSRSSASPDPA